MRCGEIRCDAVDARTRPILLCQLKGMLMAKGQAADGTSCPSSSESPQAQLDTRATEQDMSGKRTESERDGCAKRIAKGIANAGSCEAHARRQARDWPLRSACRSTRYIPNARSRIDNEGASTDRTDAVGSLWQTFSLLYSLLLSLSFPLSLYILCFSHPTQSTSLAGPPLHLLSLECAPHIPPPSSIWMP